MIAQFVWQTPAYFKMIEHANHGSARRLVSLPKQNKTSVTCRDMPNVAQHSFIFICEAILELFLFCSSPF